MKAATWMVVLGLVGCAPAAVDRPAAVAAAVMAAVPAASAVPGAFALLELFTSEGCSSTPPAEAVVNRVLDDAEARGLPVYALAFHVTYWDQLGWKDRYASDPNVERQRAYARALGHAQIYTPQVVLDGAGDLPWDRPDATATAIASSLAAARPAAVTLAKAGTAAGSFTVRYDVTGAPAGTRLYVALAERALRVTPDRGENAGHLLSHGPVVQAFADVAPGAGTTTLAVPASVDLAHAAVVAFVQDPTTMRLAGAARLALTIP